MEGSRLGCLCPSCPATCLPRLALGALSRLCYGRWPFVSIRVGARHEFTGNAARKPDGRTGRARQMASGQSLTTDHRPHSPGAAEERRGSGHPEDMELKLDNGSGTAEHRPGSHAHPGRTQHKAPGQPPQHSLEGTWD